MDNRDFFSRLSARQTVVGVVGLGYVGLPLMLTFTRSGFKVIGFDVDGKKITQLRAGRSYIKHIESPEIAARIDDGRFEPTVDYANIARCDAIIICVPTPLSHNREPDMTYVVNTANAIAPHLRRGQLVSLESTTYPGTTDGILRERLESVSKLTAGREFMLAYSPEREDPGNACFNNQSIPKVVGGLTPLCAEAAAALYGAALDSVVRVSSTRVAEMTKLLENIFRSVNIALVNELKMLSEKMNIDIWEVIQAASTKPFGFMPFYPGPGLGGHCIPIDPFYLTWKAREYEQSTRFIELAGEINTAMPNYVIERLITALNKQRKPLNGSKVLILGVAYKRDVDDMRESPALRILTLLRSHGAETSYHDPFVAKLPRTRAYNLDMTSVSLTEATLGGIDAAVIVTDHTGVDYDMVVRCAPLVVDTRNATKHVVKGRQNVIKA